MCNCTKRRHQRPCACNVIESLDGFSRFDVCAAAAVAVQGITTAIAYQHGMGSSAFALAVALSSIVMYDAAGVRRHAGGDKQDPGLSYA